VDAEQYKAANLESSFRVGSDTLTSFAGATRSTWPFVTMTDFDTWGGNIGEQSNTEFVGFAPIVANQEEKDAWEEYSKQTDAWYMTEQDTIDSNATTTTTSAKTANSNKDVAPRIFVMEDFEGDILLQPQRGPGPYAPVWQIYPKAGKEQIINFDLLSNVVFQGMYETLLETGHGVISPVMNLQGFYHGATGGSSPESTEPNLPKSVFFEPVYDTLHGDARILKGILFGVISWKEYFAGLLQDPKEEVSVIMENDCGQNFQFYMRPNPANGKDVWFQGYNVEASEDETINSDLSVSAVFGASNHTHPPTTPSDAQEVYHCHYRMDVYPTLDLQMSYETDLPMMVSALILCMFFITAIAFMVYVTYIQNRQKQLLAFAVQTSKIVSSLFPASVRDRIMKEAEDQAFQELIEKQESNNKLSKKTWQGGNASQSNLMGRRQSFLQSHLVTAAGNFEHAARAPIAEVFQETTVFFGDIVGKYLLGWN